ncbi:MAG: pyridoxamine 5'-phosphate oxidase [Alphaproteobacteria bacterium]|nr:pyridoxamine 5'-phosphate oxidase [Alphaproteobacteria bacterium]
MDRTLQHSTVPEILVPRDVTDPFALFDRWLAAAFASEPNDANAMVLSTVSPAGRPSSRIVLLKGVELGPPQPGFIFYTNLHSQKGTELSHHPQACLNFHWKSLLRQVRIEGRTVAVSHSDADEYFASRPYQSQIGAWASSQSRPLQDRKMLLDRVAELVKTYPEPIVPRPPHWSGFKLIPDRIEFWQNQEFRLHDRLVYHRPSESEAWQTESLYP